MLPRRLRQDIPPGSQTVGPRIYCSFAQFPHKKTGAEHGIDLEELHQRTCSAMHLDFLRRGSIKRKL